MSSLLAIICFFTFIATIILFIISVVIKEQTKGYKTVRKLLLIVFLVFYASFMILGVSDSRDLSGAFILTWMIAFVSACALSIRALVEKHRKENHKHTKNMAVVAYLIFFICFIASGVLMWNNPTKASEQVAEVKTDAAEVDVKPEVEKKVEDEEEKENKTEADENKVEEEKKADGDKTEADENKVEEEKKADGDKTQEVTDDNDSFSIILVADEPNEYSEELVLNEGRGEDEYRMLGYFIPAGTYEFTNLGEYPTQITIYKNEKHTTEEGWEEWSDGEAERLQVDETIEMTVKEGYFVKLSKPDYIKATKID